jgi:hypothetical protein
MPRRISGYCWNHMWQRYLLHNYISCNHLEKSKCLSIGNWLNLGVFPEDSIMRSCYSRKNKGYGVIQIWNNLQDKTR